MRERKARSSLWLIVGLFCLLSGAQSAAAQDNVPARDDEAIKELVSEVRMLRQALQALQRGTLDTHRSQLLIDQIRLNREHVRQLTASLNETRDTLAKTQITIAQLIERVKLVENQAQLEVNQSKRAELEFGARRTMETAENYKSQIDPLKAREQQLSTELNSEKAKLEELESRLDRLERAIENDRQKLEVDKPIQKAP